MCPNSTVCFSDSAGSVANSLISDSACMIRSRASSLRSGARRALVSLTVGGSIWRRLRLVHQSTASTVTCGASFGRSKARMAAMLRAFGSELLLTQV